MTTYDVIEELQTISLSKYPREDAGGLSREYVLRILSVS